MANEKILMVMMSVTDMAKAKAFYAEQLGWSVTQDYGQGDQHWVTLSLPGGGATLTLSTMHGKMKPGTMTLYLSTSDIEARWFSPSRLRDLLAIILPMIASTNLFNCLNATIRQVAGSQNW